MISVEEFKKRGLINILIPGIGYGRNARPFIDKRFSITGIEVSESAINVARANKIDCTIHHGSVTDMPFDSQVYDAVFCYALIHLLNKHERKHFLRSCFTLPIGKNLLMANDVPESMGRTNENENGNKISISAESKEEADKLFNGLSVGGQIEVPIGDSP